MIGGNYDRASSFFSGGGFVSPQPSQAPDPSSSPIKSVTRAQRVLPLTVKQISDAFHSSFDGIQVSNMKLLGLVMNMEERVGDAAFISFTLDDGTGRIEIGRWLNETSDVSEMALIQNGIYVKVNAHLKGFQEKHKATAFSVRPVTDFNDITLHFLEHPGHVAMHRPADDVYSLVMGVLQEPASLARGHGLHIQEIVRSLGLPINKIMEAIKYHVDAGHIYSTIDDKHFKSACNP